MVKPFEGLFGNNCELRLIEFLLPLEGMEFNITELAEEIKISRPTAIKIVKKFVEWGLLKIGRKKGGTNYYQINHDSPFVRLFEQFNNLIIENMLEDEVLYAIHDYREQHFPTLKKGPLSNSKPESIINTPTGELWEIYNPVEKYAGTGAFLMESFTKPGRDFNAAD